MDGDEGRTMEDEDPEPAFEEIERGPLADFDDDELRGILARADLDAEDDGEDLLDEDDVNDEDDDEEDLGEGARETGADVHLRGARRAQVHAPAHGARTRRRRSRRRRPRRREQEEEAAQPRSQDRRAKPRGEGVVRGPRHPSQPPEARGTPRARARAGQAGPRPRVHRATGRGSVAARVRPRSAPISRGASNVCEKR